MTPAESAIIEALSSPQNQAFISEQGLALIVVVIAFGFLMFMQYKREQRQGAIFEVLPARLATLEAAVESNGDKIDSVERYLANDIKEIRGYVEEGKRVIRHIAARTHGLEVKTGTTPPPAESGIPLDAAG